MKRIAIFCDGTWNTPDKNEDGKPCRTNVVKMANALSETSLSGVQQLMFYETGIGSEGDLLDMKSSKVTEAFIQGRAINLDNKQTQLFEKYKYKYSIR